MTTFNRQQKHTVYDVIKEVLNDFTSSSKTRRYVLKQLLNNELFEYFPDNIDVLISKIPEIAKIDIRAVLYTARTKYEELINAPNN